MSNIRLITNNLGKQLLEQIETASSISILTSFVMKSGVKYIRESLKIAADRGADIKICTGDYLYVTQPEALEELLSIDNKVEIRLWQSNGVSFHPKAYLFKTENQDCLFIGSSNLSKSALSNGVEWNLSVSDEKEVFEEALEIFLRTFYSKQTIPLNKETLKEYVERYKLYHTKNPNLANKWSQMEERDLMLPTEKDGSDQPELIHDGQAPYGEIKPRFAQIEALEELQKTLDEEYNKALVVMATGLGKTYLAGFFAQNFKRILFIAHREEILYQAKDSFQKIMPEKKFGIYNGKVKEGNADAIFASIFTLSMKTHLQQFQQDEFDLIIIDEFHHAAADSYQRVLDYFTPKFLLGITATPDRNDNKDVYAICDGNVAFQLDFLDAIQRKWLAPFKYFGIYDDTDYSQIRWLGTHYDEEKLLQVQLREELATKILRAWEDKKQTRTIGFCSSIRQANYLSNFFNQHGYKTVSLHSQQIGLSRKAEINKLSDGEIDVIFTVDLFNEGVDIPAVDTLLFVRPTESLTVFTQQIGRGLRLHDDKDSCVIIDLIGNYRNADVKLSLFDNSQTDKRIKNILPTVPIYCEMNLDLKVIDLIQEMARKKNPLRDKLYNAFIVLKQDIGRRPTYLELHLKGRENSKLYQDNFGSYIGFLKWAKELTTIEEEVFIRYKKWIEECEKTDMKKSYKMVVLLAMLERGSANWFEPITAKEVAPFFHKYLTEKEYRKRLDFSDKKTKKLWEYNEKRISDLIETMPMTKWVGEIASFENGIFTLKLEVFPEDQQILFYWTKEICEYRLHFHFERKANKPQAQ